MMISCQITRELDYQVAGISVFRLNKTWQWKWSVCTMYDYHFEVTARTDNVCEKGEHLPNLQQLQKKVLTLFQVCRGRLSSEMKKGTAEGKKSDAGNTH